MAARLQSKVNVSSKLSQFDQLCLINQQGKLFFRTSKDSEHLFITAAQSLL